MGTTLYLDAGNSSMKAAAFMQDEWKTLANLTYDRPVLVERLRELCRSFDRVVVASVKRSWQPADIEKLLDTETVGINREDLPADRLQYRSVETMGIDRFLSCLGAWSINRSAVIVSDTGTACTIDVMNDSGIYLGGVIMPGIQMMISTLGEGADGLFRVARRLPSSWPPQTTEEALQAGTIGTFLAAWESHIEKSRALFPHAQIWLTGGDASFLEQHSAVESKKHEHLVFEGMRKWFLYYDTTGTRS